MKLKTADNVVVLRAEWSRTENKQAKEFMIEDLGRSGLLPKHVGAYPVEHVQRPGMPAYILPYMDTDDYWRIKFKVPAEYPYGKYKAPKGQGARIYAPPGMDREAYRQSSVKYICEGEKKAAKLFVQYHVPVAGIAGCWMWGHKVKGEKALLPELQDMIKARDQIIYIADRDILDPKKLDIGKAAKSLMHVLETSMNCAFQVLLPPDPYKGVDDWMAAGNTEPLHDGLEELDLSQYAWFPLKLLQSVGITFRANKDGDVLSYKQAIPNHLNSELFAQLIYANNPGVITLDKYRGYVIRDKPVGAAAVLGEMVSGINAYFPEYTVNVAGVQNFLVKYCDEAGAGNCIRDYVESLTWDGTPRLATWLPQTVKLPSYGDTTYAAGVGRAMICAMYSRIMNPGCQQDFMFIFIGPQGVGKSQFFRLLGSFPDHAGYHAVTVAQLGKMDYTMGLALKRAVVLDVDDLDNMRRSDQGELKSFVTRVTDAWREIYTTRIVEEPRGFILTGSTNNRKILDDVTGNRRYLAVEVLDIRTVTGPFRWSERLRDQLLAECHATWSNHRDNWWDIDIAVINKNNAAFTVEDPVCTAIAEMLEQNKLGRTKKGAYYITAVALSRWLDDPRYSPINIGIRLAKLQDTQHATFRVGEKTYVSTADFETMPDQVMALFKTQNKITRTWAYTIKPM